MEKFLKKTGRESIITSIVFALIGILLICNPEGTFKIASTILGIAFIVVGAVKIISYISNKGNYDFYNYELVYGIVAIIVGIVIIAYSGVLEVLFRLIVGIWIIYSGIMRMMLALKLKTANSNTWYAVLAIAVLMIILGLFITFNSGAVVITIGVITLVYAVMDLIEGCIFIRNVDNVFKDK